MTQANQTKALRPQRYLLSPERLAAAFDMAGVKAGDRFPDLPDAANTKQLLAETTVVDAKGELTAESKMTLDIAASATRSLSVVTLFPSDQRIRGVQMFQKASSESVVVEAKSDRGWDLTFLPTTTQAIAMLDGLLSLSALPDGYNGPPFVLDTITYTALLAAADVIQDERLDARRERARRPLPNLDVAKLEQQLATGLASTDSRWAVCAGRMTSPIDLSQARGKMSAGVRGLVSAGLATDSNPSRLTARGLALATQLGYLTSATGLIASNLDQDGVSTGTATVFRSVSGLFIALWLGGDAGAVEVREVSAGSALGLIRSLLEEPDTQRPEGSACPNCWSINEADAKFCTRCGTAMTESAS